MGIGPGGGQMDGAGGQAEGVAVPVDARHGRARQPVVLRPEHRVPPALRRELDHARADLLHRPGGDLGPEGGGQLLGAQAHAEHRQAGPVDVAQEVPFGAQPGRASWTPMGPPRTTRPGQVVDAGQLRRVEPDHADRHARPGEHTGDRPRALVGHVLEDDPGSSRPGSTEPATTAC